MNLTHKFAIHFNYKIIIILNFYTRNQHILVSQRYPPSVAVYLKGDFINNQYITALITCNFLLFQTNRRILWPRKCMFPRCLGFGLYSCTSPQWFEILTSMFWPISSPFLVTFQSHKTGCVKYWLFRPLHVYSDPHCQPRWY